MTRAFGGAPLTPGVNVDPVSISAGLRMAGANGFVSSAEDRMVVVYALQRWARGEEDGAWDTWRSHFGDRDYAPYLRVISHAVVCGKRELALAEAKKRWTVVYSRPGFVHPETGAVTP